MKPLNSIEQKYWDTYLNSIEATKRPKNPVVEASPAGNRSITDGLLELYLSGKKTAGSSIVEDFLTAGDPLPEVGRYWILLNSKDEPGCLLRTERVVFHNWLDVPPEIAVAEGEGDLSLDYWRRAHAKLYLPHLAAWGLASIEEATIVTEYFKLVFNLR